MEQELAYSFHLGSDKNKSKLAKKVAKKNVSGTTSLSNNAIQNAKDLSDVNKHNLRDYDNQRELIKTIYGTNDIVNDVKQVYLDEFESARIEYNAKQNRDDRKIKNYFKKVCDSQNDIACEIIIELGDMDFWNDKDNEYRLKMIDVYNEQVKDLVKKELSTKEKIIGKLQTEKEKLKQELQKFKGFWHKLIKRFQNKIGFDKDEKYKYVSDDLYKNGVFDDNDNRIVNDVARKIRPTDELNNTNIKKKNNMELK